MLTTKSTLPWALCQSVEDEYLAVAVRLVFFAEAGPAEMFHQIRRRHDVAHGDDLGRGVDLRRIGERSAQLYVDQPGVLYVVVCEADGSECNPQREKNEQDLPGGAEKEPHRPCPGSYFQSRRLTFGSDIFIFP